MSWIMQNTRKGLTRGQYIDLYKEISIFLQHAVFIENENEFLKNSYFCYTWSNDHIE